MNKQANKLDIQGVVDHIAVLYDSQKRDQLIQLISAILADLNQKNTELALRYEKAMREKFGRKSEKVPVEQLSLFLEQLKAVSGENAGIEVPEPNRLLSKPKVREHTGHGRRNQFDGVKETEVQILKLSEEEKTCPLHGPKTVIGHEESTLIEFVPGHFKKIIQRREKAVCPPCGNGVVVAAPADKVIEKGLPGPGLLANILVSKYQDHMPLNRLKGIYKRLGVVFWTSTLSDWVREATDVLRPIAERILEKALLSVVLQTDDTGIRVLDRAHPNGVKRGHIWVYAGDELWAAFVFTPDWSSESARTILAQRKGWLLHDGYKGYDVLHTQDGGPVEVACLAHVRRRFVEALEGGDLRAALVVDWIRQLYEVEREAKDFTAEARLALRQEKSKPLMDKFKLWLDDMIGREPPKSSLGEAIGYAHKRWVALTRFLEDGRLPIDNNLAERTLRAIAVGRKNYLFAGSEAGGERAAIAYTILGTCALCGADPQEYVRDVLVKISSGWPHSRLDELLPPNWLAARSPAVDVPKPGSPLLEEAPQPVELSA